MSEKTVDRKFKILAVNPINCKYYTEKNSVLFVAKDAALPATLEFYKQECISLGCNAEHIASVELLIGRVMEFQNENESRVADTVGEEIPRCIHGVGIEE